MHSDLCEPRDVARRLADYAVLLHDPELPSISATFWEYSEAPYRAVRDEWSRLAQLDAGVAGAYEQICADARNVRLFRQLEEHLTALLDKDPDAADRAVRIISRADQEIYIDHFLGDEVEARPAVAPVTAGTMRGHLSTLPSPVTSGVRDPLVQVVIPFRDRDGGDRLRNLLACLAALRDQDLPDEQFSVTVVEGDDRPHWREVIEPLVQQYLFVPQPGLFNKSWTVNVGVVQAPVAARLICVLDADILVDREFLTRNAARLADPANVGHLTYRRYTNLDSDTTDAAIHARCFEKVADLPRAMIRAYVLREPPGGCLWVTSEAFHRVGGFDERFQGWGGEDNDVVDRLTLLGGFLRFDDELWHMDHPRPVMRVAGRSFNGHLEPLTWTPEMGYGRLELATVQEG